MGGQSSQECACLGRGEPSTGQPRCGLDGLETESSRRDRVTRQSEGTEQVGEEQLGILGQRFHQPAIGLGVRTERSGGLLDGPFEHGGGAVVEWVGERRRRVDQLQAMLDERNPLEERRGHREGMNRRADVVHEAGQRQRRRPCAAADCGRRLDDEDRETFVRAA